MNKDSRFKNSKITARQLNSGQAMITAVMFFLFITVTIVGGVSFSVLRQVKSGQDLIRSKESYYISEAGVEDVTYRIKNSKNYSAAEALSLGGFTANTTVSDISGGKIISSATNRDGDVRKVAAQVAIGAGVAFNYGIQTGQGGFGLEGGSQVNGSVYANGSILAQGGVVITGSATAANSAALAADQTNNSPSAPPSSVVFRNASASQDFAQSFGVSTSEVVGKLQLYIKKTGSPSNITVRIVEDNAGAPSGAQVTSAQLSSGLVTTNYGWVDVLFPSGSLLAVGTTYWLVLDSGSTSSSNYYVIGANSGVYGTGTGKVGQYGGTWSNTSPAGLDGYFVLYLGGQQSLIGGGDWTGSVVIGSGGVGDAWAHTVTGASVAGTIYCQTGSSNNKACNTTKGDPDPQPYPISQGMVDDWKDEAMTGGTINGNYSVGWAGASLGPKKIAGNLTVDGGGTLTLTGTLWVTGSVTVTSGAKIVLASSYGTNSGVLVSDGIMNFSGGSNIKGSGQTGSYLLMLTTSDCPQSLSCGASPAIFAGSSSFTGAIFNAQNGTIALEGGATIKEATAYRITAEGGTVINYESGLINVNFSSGPSGGWNIQSWNETQ